ncbi:MAG TPA: PEP-CTERM sorting domain-containing protein [Rhizomicrobium sp.]|jgi:hypothetical protein
MAAGSLIVPTQSFNVSAFGAQLIDLTPTSTYHTYTLEFTPGTSSGIIDFSTAALCSNCATAIDELSVSTVPEPGTLAVLGAGLLGLGAIRRRRKAPSVTQR